MKNRLFLLVLVFLGMTAGIFAQSPEVRRQVLGTPPPAAPAPKAVPSLFPLGMPQPLLTVPAPAPKAPAPRVVPRTAPFLPSFSLGGTLASRYIREGWCRNSSPVAIFQGEIQESGLYLGLQEVYNFSDRAGRGRHFQDSRLYLGYAMSFGDTGFLGPVTVDVCWTYNAYPGHSRENSGSLALSLQLEEFWRGERLALTGALSLEHNYGKNQTFAVTEATLHCAIREDGALMWENSLALFWGDSRRMRALTQEDCGGNALYTLSLASSLPWEVGQWVIAPFLEADFHPDSRARKAAKRDDFNAAATVTAGLRVSRHF
ncbi:MAG: hypothetical protein ACI4SG_02050 [Oligosphaeraceae bacterium]